MSGMIARAAPQKRLPADGRASHPHPMPAESEKQARLMRAALHGAEFPKAKQIRASMSRQQISEFTHTATRQPDVESHVYRKRHGNGRFKPHARG